MGLINGQADPGAVWDQALTAQVFLQQEDPNIEAYAKDLVVPGCITLVSAPRASGKTIVALYLGVALATAGVFRDEKLTRQRVLLVDRDNAPSLVRKRMRWLGAQDVTALKVLTREKAPPLTDRAAWDTLPVNDYDIVMVDSLGAATEGVSEKEGKETQEFLATLKDLAHRGPAVLVLDNTTKDGSNYRGRGEKADAVDILYEARNVTGWTPAQGGDWWESLPDAGENAWKQRASRRNGQAVLRIAFIPSKFRLGIEPEPFILEIDTRQEPWTLADVTQQIAAAGEQAAQEDRRQAQARVTQAEEALVRALAAQPAKTPMRKDQAVAFLCDHGLTRKVARTLVEQGGNREVYPEGRWVLRPVPGHNRALTVHLAAEHPMHGAGNDVAKTPHQHANLSLSSSAVGQQSHSGVTMPITPSENLMMNMPDHQPSPGYNTAEDGMDFEKQPSGSDDSGVSCAVLPQSSAHVCPQCHCDALMDLRTHRKCPVCLWTSEPAR
jgi:hypothetical protein